MSPAHVLWAAVVLIIAVLAYRLAVRRWRNTEELAKSHERLHLHVERENLQQINAVNDHHNRLVRLERAVAEFTQVAKPDPTRTVRPRSA